MAKTTKKALVDNEQIEDNVIESSIINTEVNLTEPIEIATYAPPIEAPTIKWIANATIYHSGKKYSCGDELPENFVIDKQWIKEKTVRQA